ncbi:MAG: tyrosine-type recombinase/integrase [Porticoccus sp.]|uniref:tyrosine-type recombinase/integrase n=1 Tax=Pseudomonadati TaxID=3379134 RepID=UPI003265F181
MPRPSKIWFRKDRKTYYVRIAGKLHNLGKDKHEAKRRFHELMAAKPEPASSMPDAIAVAHLMDVYLVWVSENRAETTLEKHQRHLQSFLDSLSDQAMAAADVRTLHVDKLVSGKSWSNNYKRTILGSISGAFNWAVKRGYIDRSPIYGLDAPPSERREEFPSQAEYELMLINATEPFKSLLVFTYETAARPQEIRAMETRHYIDGKIQFPVKESKGKKETRTIYLSAAARKMVEKKRRDGFIFTNSNGEPWTKDAINCRMRRISEKVGKHYCLYSLRHLTATRWLEAGMDHLTVAKLMGHRDAAMISRVYGHLGEKTDYLQRQIDSLKM